MKNKKQQTTQQNDPQVIYRKNRHRLIQQNRQLYSQIFRLQSKVSTVLTKNLTYQFKEKVEQQKNSQKHKQVTENQILQIKKLKKKILLIKNANKPQQKQDIRLALDQLVFLKKQKQKYIYEKQALIKKRKIKDEGLQLNKPLEQQKKNMISLYKAAQRQNFDIRNKSINVERQINNLHKIKQLAKTSAPKIAQNYQFQMKKIQHQISKIQTQIKQIQKQWQPRLDALNTQYFLLIEIKQQKHRQINELQKTINTCKNRVLAMRQQQKINEDRARISQIVISPQKRQQINQIYQAEKERHQFFEQFRNRSKQQLIKLPIKQANKEDNNKKSRSKSPKIRPEKQLFQTQPLKLFDSRKKQQKLPQQRQQVILLTNKNFGQNEFSLLQQTQQQSQIKKPIKSFTSVAVGTTFYYNQQEENDN